MYEIPLYSGYRLSEDCNDIFGINGTKLTMCSTQTHLYVNVYSKERKRSELLYLHKAIALVHVPGYFPGAWVDHIDDNTFNNTPSNLQWVLPRNNNCVVKQRKKYISKERKHNSELRKLTQLISKYEMRIRKTVSKLEELQAITSKLRMELQELDK